MNGVFTYIHHKNQPNVGVYTIHGSYGNDYANRWLQRLAVSVHLPFSTTWTALA